MVDGKLCDDKKIQMVEGSDKRTPYEGIMILKNGTTLIDKLKKDGRVRSGDVDEAISIKTKEEFFEFMKHRTEEDGIFVYESAKKQLRRVSYVCPQHLEEKRNGGVLEDLIESSIPNDFIQFNSTLSPAYMRLRLGTKTRLAIEIPKSYSYGEIDVYQIKRSAYTDLGMGKVTHFNKQGLVEEFFMMPMNGGKAIEGTNPNGICGVYRSYVKENGRVKMAEEKKAENLAYVQAIIH